MDAVGAQIIATERILFGVLDLFLNGHRQGIYTSGYPHGVRTQNTNLGYLTANASLAYAESIGDFVLISLKNGSGIWSSIGQTVVSPCDT